MFARLVRPQHRALRQSAEPITERNLKLEQQLCKLMFKYHGVGIAAPQLGKSVALCLLVVDEETTVCYNPQLEIVDATNVVAEETCLSLPGIWTVTRAQSVRLTWTDRAWNRRVALLTDWEARIAQHEIDHLSGILISDHGEAANQEAQRHLRSQR